MLNGTADFWSQKNHLEFKKKPVKNGIEYQMYQAPSGLFRRRGFSLTKTGCGQRCLWIQMNPWENRIGIFFEILGFQP